MTRKPTTRTTKKDLLLFLAAAERDFAKAKAAADAGEEALHALRISFRNEWERRYEAERAADQYRAEAKKVTAECSLLNAEREVALRQSKDEVVELRRLLAAAHVAAHVAALPAERAAPASARWYNRLRRRLPKW